ncbi:MAG: hypothetical protein R3E39_12885 [Anaerolineae bacterium]
MLKVFIGVVRFPDDRDFVIMVDGEPGPVEDSVRQVIEAVWGEGDIEVLTSGVDFTEFVHAINKERARPDGYVLGCEVGGLKRINYAIQYARRLQHIPPDESMS